MTQQLPMPANLRRPRQALVWALLCTVVAASDLRAQSTRTTRASPGEWQGVVAAAHKEAKVVLYGSPPPPLLARLKADFENALPGMALEFSRVSDGVMISRLDQERKTGVDGADAVITTELRWLADRAKDGTLRPALGPEISDWPRKYVVAQGVPVIGLDPFVIVYNSNLVRVPITGYGDLLRPELKARIGVSEIAASVVAAWYDWLDKSQGGDFTAKLAAQQPRIYAGGIQSVQAAASGEVAVAAYGVPSLALPLIERGAPLKLVFPNPGFGFRYGAAVMSSARRPNAAQVFINYLLSARGQVAWVGRGDSASPRPNIPNSPDPDRIQPFEASAYPADFAAAYTAKWRSLFKK